MTNLQKHKEEPLSNCCAALRKAVSSDEGTGYYACSKCNREFISEKPRRHKAHNEYTATTQQEPMSSKSTLEPIACTCRCHCGDRDCTWKLLSTCNHATTPPNCTPLKGDWKEAFDNRFTQQVGNSLTAVTPWATLSEIKSFIESLLQQDRQRSVEKLEKKRLNPDPTQPDDDFYFKIGFNQALDEAVEIVNNREEVKE